MKPTLASRPRLRARGASPRMGLALAAAALGLALSTAPPARGAFVVTSPDVMAAPGSSGTFDLTVTNTDGPGGASVDVTAFEVELVLSGLTGVHFDDVTIDTVIPYLFVSSGTLQPGADPLSTTPFPNSDFIASDSEFAPPGARSVGPGGVFGIAHVFYTIAPSAAPGSVPLSFGGATDFIDSSPGFVLFQTEIGNFTVLPVPEPSSLVLTAGGSAVLLLAGLRRRLKKAHG
jgi:hypothetical protein